MTATSGSVRLASRTCRSASGPRRWPAGFGEGVADDRVSQPGCIGIVWSGEQEHPVPLARLARGGLEAVEMSAPISTSVSEPALRESPGQLTSEGSAVLAHEALC